MLFTGDVKAAEGFCGKTLVNAGQVLGKRQAIDGKMVAGHESIPQGVVIGNHACIPGDWIVKANGSLRVMSEAQFKRLYDAQGGK
jgi:hypothetical protein